MDWRWRAWAGFTFFTEDAMTASAGCCWGWPRLLWWPGFARDPARQLLPRTRTGTSPPACPPKRAEAEVKEDGRQHGVEQKPGVVCAVRPTGSEPPEILREEQHEKQEEGAGDLQPQDAAHAAEGAEESARSTRRVGYRSPGCTPTLVGSHGCRDGRRGRLSACVCCSSGDALAGDPPRDPQPNA